MTGDSALDYDWFHEGSAVLSRAVGSVDEVESMTADHVFPMCCSTMRFAMSLQSLRYCALESFETKLIR